MDGRETQQMNWKYSGLRMPSLQMSCMTETYDDDSFDSDFLDDSLENEEDIATDDGDVFNSLKDRFGIRENNEISESVNGLSRGGTDTIAVRSNTRTKTSKLSKKREGQDGSDTSKKHSTGAIRNSTTTELLDINTNLPRRAEITKVIKSLKSDKVLAKIMLEGLKSTLDKRLSDEQAGFRPDRSRTDHIAKCTMIRINIEQKYGAIPRPAPKDYKHSPTDASETLSQTKNPETEPSKPLSRQYQYYHMGRAEEDQSEQSQVEGIFDPMLHRESKVLY
ncbi:hypothetical protein EGW08_012132 [Elysia chlorotica]|uniref:Reverse transcriptase domain-containing protein n=1 Tax=Elysia chlorotica TaxID=188477 RepID=A0A433TEV0_ELYCH|nr:hypothetical protein EGW08_012132 [Elysia chlorotica]